MDFSYLMEIAKTNEKYKKDEKFLVTKVSKAKKLEKPSVNPKAIQKHLNIVEEKKEVERTEFVRKRTELMERQSHDKHKKKRINDMINRTKGASKAVLDDAKDLITTNGEDTIAADDFGYESSLSQQIFAKLCTQYKETPEDDRLKFAKTAKADMKDIKERVKESLKKQEEEKLGIRKRTRKRKHKGESEFDDFFNDEDPYKKFKKDKKFKSDDSSSNNTSSVSSNIEVSQKEEPVKKEEEKKKKEEEKKKKKRPPMPPPMSYMDLINAAKTNRNKPPPPPPTFIEDIPTKEKESERPLTANEKAELEEERLRKLRRSGKLPKLNTGTSAEGKVLSNASSKENGKIKKEPGNASEKKNVANEVPQKKPSDRSKYFSSPGSSSVKKDYPSVKETFSNKKEFPMRKDAYPVKNNSNPVRKDPSKFAPPRKDLSKFATPRKDPGMLFPKKNPIEKKKELSRQIYSDEDEDEYDSEMDAFIDDDDDNAGGYSSQIAQMFGYDKTKYRDIDEEDDADMVASYAQMEKEEKISAKIGMMEDLKDMEDEERHKKMKLMKKKKMR